MRWDCCDYGSTKIKLRKEDAVNFIGKRTTGKGVFSSGFRKEKGRQRLYVGENRKVKGRDELEFV